MHNGKSSIRSMTAALNPGGPVGIPQVQISGRITLQGIDRALPLGRFTLKRLRGTHHAHRPRLIGHHRDTRPALGDIVTTHRHYGARGACTSRCI